MPDLDDVLAPWGGGTTDHRALTHRNDAAQHSMASVEGLTDVLGTIGQQMDVLAAYVRIPQEDLGTRAGAVTLSTSVEWYTMTLTGDVTLTPEGLGLTGISITQDSAGGHAVSYIPSEGADPVACDVDTTAGATTLLVAVPRADGTWEVRSSTGCTR